MSTSEALFLSSWMIFDLPWMGTYSGRKPFSTSTPIFDFGRSTTWPTDAFTVKPEPRYFLMVLALAGDSTTTSARSLPARLGAFSAAAGFAAFLPDAGFLADAFFFSGAGFLSSGAADGLVLEVALFAGLADIVT
jgi:hypothetical protein